MWILNVNLKINVLNIIPSVKRPFSVRYIALPTHRPVFLSAWEVSIWNSNPTNAEIYSKSRACDFILFFNFIYIQPNNCSFLMASPRPPRSSITQHYAETISNQRQYMPQGSFTEEGVKCSDLATAHVFSLLSRRWSMEADASSKLYSPHVESQFNKSRASVPTNEL